MKRIPIVVVLALFITVLSCKDQKKEDETASLFLVTSPIQRDTILYKEYVGQVRSASHIELRSQEKGYLENIFVDEGQYVHKDQLMFKIMPTIYQAEVEKAKAEYNFAEIEYQNTRSLTEKNVVSANELALAKAKLDKAKAERSLAEAHLRLTEIRAPFSGIMDRFYTRLGSLVDEGELLTTLSDNSKMWIYFNVPESEYLDYVKNEKKQRREQVLLRLANNELFKYPGSVETIEADFNNENGNIAFRATFPNPGGLLRHGATGTILMPVVLKKAILIPQKSTFDILDRKYVYVVDNQNEITAREINVTHEMPHFYIVGSGISPGEKIIAEGLGKVKSKEKIRYTFVPFDKELNELNNLHAE